MKLCDRYLDLVKSALVNEHYVELEAQLLFSVLCASEHVLLQLPDFWAVRKDAALLDQLAVSKRDGDRIIVETGNRVGSPTEDHSLGHYAQFAYTSVGRKRLDHLHKCIEQVLSEGIPGDLLNAGIKRGGCCILMRAVLAAHDCNDRKVWAIDLADGVAQPFDGADEDRAFEAREGLRRFGLLDDQVRMVLDGLEQELKLLSNRSVAVLRIDCERGDSTELVLEELYRYVSVGGWVISENYGSSPPCQQAVDEFRKTGHIKEPIEEIDGRAICWRVA